MSGFTVNATCGMTQDRWNRMADFYSQSPHSRTDETPRAIGGLMAIRASAPNMIASFNQRAENTGSLVGRFGIWEGWEPCLQFS